MRRRRGHHYRDLCNWLLLLLLLQVVIRRRRRGTTVVMVMMIMVMIMRGVGSIGHGRGRKFRGHVHQVETVVVRLSVGRGHLKINTTTALVKDVLWFAYAYVLIVCLAQS